MKTTVIQLETHDDVVSIRDKMAWQSCQRMILVWPKRGKLLRDAIDLSLLKRTAGALGSDLALVCHHPVILEDATVVGVPVFASIPSAEKGDWDRVKPPRSEKRFPKGEAAITRQRDSVKLKKLGGGSRLGTRIISLVLSLSSVAALAIYLLPSASITLYPVLSPQSVTIPIQASPEFSGANPSGNIHAKLISAELSGELSRPGSGVTSIPAEKATGEVVFTNLTDHAVLLPAGSNLSSGTPELPLEFILTKDVTLSAENRSTALGYVEAAEPGVEGNLHSGDPITLVGPMALLVSTSVDQDFQGGSSLETTSPAEADYFSLKTQLLKELENQALSVLRSQLEKNEVLIDPTLAVEEILLEEQVNPPGEPADSALLRMTVRFIAAAYNKTNLEAIASVVLDGNLPDGMMDSGDGLHIESIKDYSITSEGAAVWMIRASRLMLPVWKSEDLANQIAGQKVEVAQTLIDAVMPQLKPGEIKGILFGWPWMPFMPTRIQIEIGSDA